MPRILLVLVLTLPLHAAEKPAESPLVPAVESTARGGLPNFFDKLKAGKEVRIAYLGGSITAQEGWRPKTLAHFQKAYPDAKVSQINAAIGGTGSDLGVFRLGHDVLQHKPDLLFVEFAVNDGGAPPERIFKTMEGIVRQTWKALPDCDICFVYTLVEGMAGDLQNGKFPRAASAMEKVADHYGIPSIHMGLKVAQLAKEGKLVFKGPLPKTDAEKAAAGDKIIFSPDSVHPYPETGHQLYLESILRSLPAIQAAGTKVGAHALATPFVPDNYEDAKMVPIDKAKLSSGFVKLDPATDSLAKRFTGRTGTLYRTNKPGETISFKFKGRYAAIYDLLAPDAGQVIVTVDNNPPVIRPRFDAYCTYARLATLPVAVDLPNSVHSVKIVVHKDQPDKVKILAQRKEKMDNPKRFDDTAIYPGAILLLGDLVEE